MQLVKEWLRKCCTCKTIFTLDEGNFYKCKSPWKSWFDSRCKRCNSLRKKSIKYRTHHNDKKRINKLYDWYVYVLQSWLYYKIWATIHNDVKKRIKSMMHWNPLEIKSVMINKSKWDMYNEEKMFHRMFINKKIRWERFLLEEQDIELIKNYYTD